MENIRHHRANTKNEILGNVIMNIKNIDLTQITHDTTRDR